MRFLSQRLATAHGPTIHVSTNDPADLSIFFFHGVGRCWRTFLPLIPAIAERWPILALDQRGHGESDRAGRYLVADYFADAVSVVKELAERTVVLYGHSLGALVAAMVAAELPDLVSAVVLEDPPSPGFLDDLKHTAYLSTFRVMRANAGPTNASTDTVARRLADSMIERPDGTTIRLGELRDAVSLRFAARCLRDVDPAVYDPILAGRWLDGIDWWERVTAIRCPTLLLHGDVAAGGMLPSADANELARRIPDLTAMRLAGAGHVLHWQHTATVANHLIGFLESL
jgi:pimeloyl-ACP methyl ester carboxylesterase